MDSRKVSTPLLGITNKLLDDFIERNDNGTLTGKSQRLFRVNRGKKFSCIGKRTYFDSGVRHINDIRNHSISNFLINVKNAYLSRARNGHGETILTVSDSSTKERSWIRKQFHKLGRGVTHFSEAREVRRTAKELLIKRLDEVMESFGRLEGVSEEVQEAYSNAMEEWKALLRRIITLEIKAYSQGTGKQHLKAHKLLRLSMVIDQLLEYACYDARTVANALEFPEETDTRSRVFSTLSTIVATMDKYKKSGGIHQLHTYVGNLSKTLNEMTKRDMSLGDIHALPSSTDELRILLSNYMERTGDSTAIPNVLGVDIVSLFDTLIGSLPTPVSIATKALFDSAKEELLASLHLRESAGILSKGCKLLATESFEKHVHKNDAKALELLELIKETVSLFTHLREGQTLSQAINAKVSLATWKNNPTLLSMWNYVCSVYDVLQSGNPITASIERVDIPSCIYQKRLCELQKRCLEIVESDVHTEHALTRVNQAIEQLTERIHSSKMKELASRILLTSDNVNLNKHVIRLKRFTSGLRKVLFSSSTVASKIFRRATTTASVVGASIAGPVFGAQALAVPIFSNGDWAIITASQLGTIVSKATIVGQALLANLALPLSSHLISHYSAEKNTQETSSGLYEDSHSYRKGYSFIPKHRTHYSMFDVHRTLEQKKELPPFHEVASFEVLSTYDIDTCMMKVKDILTTYLHTWTTQYPENLIHFLMQVLHRLDRAPQCVSKNYMYRGVFEVILPYIKTLKNTRVAELAYQDIKRNVAKADGTYTSRLLFMRPGEKPTQSNDAALKELLMKTIKKEEARIAKYSLQGNSHVQFFFKRNSDRGYAIFDEVQSRINHTHFTDENSLEIWQKEFTPEFLNALVDRYTPHEIQSIVTEYMERWLPHHNYSIPGFIASMIYACSQMRDVPCKDDSYVKNGITYYPSMKYYIVSSILSYLKNIPHIFTDRERVQSVFEALYMLSDKISLEQALTEGLVTHHAPRLKFYFVEQGKESEHNIFQQMHALPVTSAYYPFSCEVLFSLQSLWNQANPEDMEPIHHRLATGITALNMGLHDAIKHNTFEGVSHLAQEMHDVFTNELQTKGAVTSLSSSQSTVILHHTALLLIYCIQNMENDAHAKPPLTLLLNDVIRLLYRILLQRRSMPSSFVSNNHILAAALDSCDHNMLKNAGFEVDSIERLIEGYLIQGMYYASLPHSLDDFSLEEGRSLVSRVAQALERSITNRNQEASRIEYRVRELQKCFTDFFGRFVHMEWDMGNGQRLLYPGIQSMLIRCFMESFEKHSSSPAIKAQLIEALVRATCVEDSVKSGTLRLQEKGLAYLSANDVNDQRATNELHSQVMRTLRTLYNTYARESILERLQSYQWHRITLADFEESILQHTNAGLSGVALADQLVRYVQSILTAYLPHDTTNIPTGFIQYLVNLILHLQRTTIPTGERTGVYLNAPLLQVVLQHIVNIDDINVRNSAIDEVFSAVCVTENGKCGGNVVLRPEIMFDFSITTSPRGQEIYKGFCGEGAYAHTVIQQMLEHSAMLRDKGITKEQISHNPDVVIAHKSLQELQYVLEGEEEHLVQTQSAQIYRHSELKRILDTMLAIAQRKDVLAQLQATPEIRELLYSINVSLSALIAHMHLRGDLVLLKRLLTTINMYSNIADYIVLCNEDVIHRINVDIDVCREQYLNQCDYYVVSSTIDKLHRGGNLSTGVVREVQLTLERFFPVTQEVQDINMGLFEHMLYEILSLSQPYIVNPIVGDKKTYYATYVISALQSVLQHIYAMNRDVARIYYEKMLDILTYYDNADNGTRVRKISSGLVVTDVDENGNDVLYGESRRALEHMLMMSDAVILDKGLLPRNLYEMREAYTALLSTINDTSRLADIMSYMEQCNESMFYIQPEDNYSAHIVLDLPRTFPILFGAIRTSHAALPPSLLLTLLQRVLPLYVTSSLCDISLVAEVRAFMRSLEEDVCSALDISACHQSVNTTILDYILGRTHSRTMLKESCYHIIQHYMTSYFTPDASGEYPQGVVTHIVKAILGLDGRVEEETDDVVKYSYTYKGMLLFALLEYIQKNLLDTKAKSLALQECEKEICVHECDVRMPPILRQDIIASIDMEQDISHSFVYGLQPFTVKDSFHRKIANTLHALHSNVYNINIPQDICETIYMLSEIAYVSPLFTAHGQLTEFAISTIQSLLSMFAQHEEDTLQEIRRYCSEERCARLISNILLSLSYVEDNEHRALLEELLSHCNKIYNPQPLHTIALYARQYIEGQPSNIFAGVNDALQKIQAGEYLSDEESFNYAIPALLGGILHVLSLSQSTKAWMKEVDIVLLQEVANILITSPYKFHYSVRQMIVDFLHAFSTHEELSQEYASRLIQHADELQAHDADVQKGFDSLLTMPSVMGLLSDEEKKGLTSTIERLAQQYDAGLYLDISSIYSADELKEIAIILLRYLAQCNEHELTLMQSYIRNILTAMQVSLQQAGNVSSASIIQAILDEKHISQFIQYIVDCDADKDMVTALFELFDGAFDEGAIITALHGMSSEDSKTFLYKYLSFCCAQGLSFPLDSVQGKALYTFALHTNSFEWRTLLWQLTHENSPEKILIEGIKALYEYGISVVEHKAPHVYAEYIKVLSTLVAYIPEIRHAVHTPEMYQYITSLTRTLFLLKKEDKANTALYDMLLKYCRAVLSAEYESAQRNELRVHTMPSDVMVEDTVALMERLVHMLWRQSNGEPIHHLHALLEEIVARLQCIDLGNMSSVIEPALVHQCIAKILSFKESNTLQYHSVCVKLLEQCMKLLSHDEARLNSIRSDVELFILNTILPNNTERTINDITAWCADVDLNSKERAPYVYQDISTLLVLLQRTDMQALAPELLMQILTKVLSFHGCHSDVYREKCYAILRAILRVLPKQEYKDIVLRLQKMLFSSPLPYNWLLESPKTIEASLLEGAMLSKKEKLQKYVKRYIDTYIPQSGYDEYPHGVVQHLLAIAREFGLYDAQEDSSCPPSIFSYQGEIVKALLEYLQQASIPLRILRQIVAEVMHTLCTKDYIMTQVPVYDVTSLGVLDYRAYKKKDGSMQYIPVEALLDEHSYLSDVTLALYNLQQKVFPQEAMTQDVFTFLNIFYQLACKHSLMEHNQLTLQHAAMLEYLASCLENPLFELSLVQCGNQKLFERMFTMLANERAYYGVSQGIADRLLHCCEEVLVQIAERDSLMELDTIASWNTSISHNIIYSILEDLQTHNVDELGQVQTVQRIIDMILQSNVPITGGHYQKGFIRYLLLELGAIEHAVSIQDVGKVQSRGVWLQHIMQHIADIQNNDIRNACIAEVLEVLFENVSDIPRVLQCQWAVDIDAFGNNVRGAYTHSLEAIGEYLYRCTHYQEDIGEREGSLYHTTRTMLNALHDIVSGLSTIVEGGAGDTTSLIQRMKKLYSYYMQLSLPESIHVRFDSTIDEKIQECYQLLNKIDYSKLNRIELEILALFCNTLRACLSPLASHDQLEQCSNNVSHEVEQRRAFYKGVYDSSSIIQAIAVLREDEYIKDITSVLSTCLQQAFPLKKGFYSEEEQRQGKALFEHILCELLPLRNYGYPESSIVPELITKSGKICAPTYLVPTMQVLIAHILQLKDLAMGRMLLAQIVSLYADEHGILDSVLATCDIHSPSSMESQQFLYLTSMQEMLHFAQQVLSGEECEHVTSQLYKEHLNMIEGIRHKETTQVILQRMEKVNTLASNLPLYSEEVMQLYADLVQHIADVLEFVVASLHEFTLEEKVILQCYLDTLYMYYPTYSHLSEGHVINDYIKKVQEKLYQLHLESKTAEEGRVPSAPLPSQRVDLPVIDAGEQKNPAPLGDRSTILKDKVIQKVLGELSALVQCIKESPLDAVPVEDILAMLYTLRESYVHVFSKEEAKHCQMILKELLDCVRNIPPLKAGIETMLTVMESIQQAMGMHNPQWKAQTALQTRINICTEILQRFQRIGILNRYYVDVLIEDIQNTLENIDINTLELHFEELEKAIRECLDIKRLQGATEETLRCLLQYVHSLIDIFASTKIAHTLIEAEKKLSAYIEYHIQDEMEKKTNPSIGTKEIDEIRQSDDTHSEENATTSEMIPVRYLTQVLTRASTVQSRRVEKVEPKHAVLLSSIVEKHRAIPTPVKATLFCTPLRGMTKGVVYEKVHSQRHEAQYIEAVQDIYKDVENSDEESIGSGDRTLYKVKRVVMEDPLTVLEQVLTSPISLLIQQCTPELLYTLLISGELSTYLQMLLKQTWSREQSKMSDVIETLLSVVASMESSILKDDIVFETYNALWSFFKENSASGEKDVQQKISPLCMPCIASLCVEGKTLLKEDIFTDAGKHKKGVMEGVEVSYAVALTRILQGMVKDIVGDGQTDVGIAIEDSPYALLLTSGFVRKVFAQDNVGIKVQYIRRLLHASSQQKSSHVIGKSAITEILHVLNAIENEKERRVWKGVVLTEIVTHLLNNLTRLDLRKEQAIAIQQACFEQKGKLVSKEISLNVFDVLYDINLLWNKGFHSVSDMRNGIRDILEACIHMREFYSSLYSISVVGHLDSDAVQSLLKRCSVNMLYNFMEHVFSALPVGDLESAFVKMLAQLECLKESYITEEEYQQAKFALFYIASATLEKKERSKDASVQSACSRLRKAIEQSCLIYDTEQERYILDSSNIPMIKEVDKKDAMLEGLFGQKRNPQAMLATIVRVLLKDSSTTGAYSHNISSVKTTSDKGIHITNPLEMLTVVVDILREQDKSKKTPPITWAVFNSASILSLIDSDESRRHVSALNARIASGTLEKLLKECSEVSEIKAFPLQKQEHCLANIAYFFDMCEVQFGIEDLHGLFSNLFSFVEESRGLASRLFGECVQKIAKSQLDGEDAKIVMNEKVLATLAFILNDMIERNNCYFFIGMISGEEGRSYRATTAFQFLQAMYAYICDNKDDIKGGALCRLIMEQMKELSSVVSRARIILQGKGNSEVHAIRNMILELISSLQ